MRTDCKSISESNHINPVLSAAVFDAIKLYILRPTGSASVRLPEIRREIKTKSIKSL